MSVTEPSLAIPALDDSLDLGDARTTDRVRARRRAHSRGWLVRRALLAADTIGLWFAFALAQLFFGSDVPDAVPVHQEYLFFALSLPLWVTAAKIYGLYDNDAERTDHSTVDEVASVFHLVTLGAWLLVASTWLTGWADPDLQKLAGFWGLALAAVLLARASARAYCRRQVAFVQNVVIVGAGDVGQLVAHKLVQHPEYGVNLLGFVDAEPRDLQPALERVPVLGPPERLPAMVRLFDIERVVVAFSGESHEEQLQLIRSLKDLDVQVDIVPRLFEIVGPNVGVHTVEGLPLVSLPSLRLSRSSRLIKRELDIVGSALAILLLSPVLAAVALAVRLRSPGPALFRQTRMGQRSRPFTIFKFRTMYEDAEERKLEVAHLNMHLRPGGDARMFKVENDPRITPLGGFLRRYSLDELPQLFNVLRGEMSLVGPRPLVLEEDRWVREWARQRLDLKPGITGPWQVLGAADIPFEEMVRLDYLYVTSWSLGRDLSLLVRTIPRVVKGNRTVF